jgi:hypothetical protein
MMNIAGRICLIVLLAAMLPGLSLAQTPQQQQAGPPERDNSKFVVFIHGGSATGTVDDRTLKEIAVSLLGKRYVVRAPDAERDEVGGPGVDYFSDYARDAAQDVADTVNTKLRELKLLTDDGKALKPRLQRLKNPPGYLGVWLF